MKTTIDTYTGRRFRWNTTTQYAGFCVPARMTARTAVHLHPSRVRPALLVRIRPLRSSTVTCFMNDGSAMSNGCASTETVCAPRPSMLTIAQRVGSDSAWNTSLTAA